MFTLLHTNDFHNALDSGQADCLRRMRAALGGHGLLLDAGDAVASGNVTFRPGGETILNVMSDAGYDALTVGNREFHFLDYGFRCKVRLARFPVLCANLRPVHAQSFPEAAPVFPSDEDKSAGEKRHEQMEAALASPPAVSCIGRDLHEGGKSLRVLIAGLTVPMITERMLSRKVSAHVFDDPIATAAQLVPALHKLYKPDLMVALTHIGIGQDRKLARSVPGIDLIIGGHTHVVLEQGERVGDTLIVQAGSHAKFVGRVDVEIAAASDTEQSSQAEHAIYTARPATRLQASLLPLPKKPTETQMLAMLHSLGQPGHAGHEASGYKPNGEASL